MFLNRQYHREKQTQPRTGISQQRFQIGLPANKEKREEAKYKLSPPVTAATREALSNGGGGDRRWYSAP